MRKIIVILSSLLIFISLGNIQIFSQDFKIIVNVDNPVNKLKRAKISDLFLKKAEIFPDGLKALPVDLTPHNPLREQFSQKIHKREVKAVEAYWQHRIFSGQSVPPPVKNTEEEIIDYVIHNPGAIGYVSVSISSPGIKEIEVD
jgi:ABC-type phosphate transport system substrate-binding protein